MPVPLVDGDISATVTYCLRVFLAPAVWKAFTAFVQELILQHQHVEQSDVREAAPLLLVSEQEGRPPKGRGRDEGRSLAPSGPLKGGEVRRRQPPSTKARGVILPLHLRVGHMHCYHTYRECSIRLMLHIPSE